MSELNTLHGSVEVVGGDGGRSDIICRPRWAQRSGCPGWRVARQPGRVDPDISSRGRACCNWFGNVDRKSDKDRVFHLKQRKWKKERDLFVDITKPVAAQPSKNCEKKMLDLFTSMYAHVSVPRRPVVQSFTADWTFLPFLGISHSCCL